MWPAFLTFTCIFTLILGKKEGSWVSDLQSNICGLGYFDTKFWGIFFSDCITTWSIFLLLCTVHICTVYILNMHICMYILNGETDTEIGSTFLPCLYLALLLGSGALNLLKCRWHYWHVFIMNYSFLIEKKTDIAVENNLPCILTKDVRSRTLREANRRWAWRSRCTHAVFIRNSSWQLSIAMWWLMRLMLTLQQHWRFHFVPCSDKVCSMGNKCVNVAKRNSLYLVHNSLLLALWTGRGHPDLLMMVYDLSLLPVLQA